MKSKSTILTPGSEIIASKYPESQKGGGFMTLSKEKNFIERLVQMCFAIHCSSGTSTVVAQWLRCCATNRKVAGSIPAGVIGIFQ